MRGGAPRRRCVHPTVRAARGGFHAGREWWEGGRRSVRPPTGGQVTVRGATAEGTLAVAPLPVICADPVAAPAGTVVGRLKPPLALAVAMPSVVLVPSCALKVTVTFSPPIQPEPVTVM